jgi:hypothetical protein
MKATDRVGLPPQGYLTVINTFSNQTPPRFKAELRNTGVGPAIITRFEVFLDNKEDKHFDVDVWLDFPQRSGLAGTGGGSCLDVGDFFAPGQILPLVFYRGSEDFKEIRNAYRQTRIEIDYKSVYGEKFPTCKFEGADFA